MRKKLQKLLFNLVLLAALGAGGTAWGQILSNQIEGTNPHTSNPYTTGQTVAQNATATGIGRGTGIAAATSNTNNRYAAIGWNSPSLDANDYFYITITPNTGYKLNFTNFVYTGQASGTGPTAYAFRSSIDNYGSNIGTPTAIGTTIDLSSNTYQNITTAITFRIYGWGASAGTGTFSVNDFTFDGTVAPVFTCTAPTINTQPVNAIANIPGTAQFSVAASAPASPAPSLAYQWQFRTSSAGTWANVSTGSGGTTATYTTPATTTAMNGYQYQVIVTNNCSGGTAASTTSNTATLTTLDTAPAATISGTLNEATLDNATFNINLANTTYATTLSAAGFTLNNAPAGLSIASVQKTSDTQATVTLSYNNTDFDANASFNVTIAAGQLTTGAAVTSSNSTITAVIEAITAGNITFSPASPCVNTTADGPLAFTFTSLKSGNVTISGATAVFKISESASGPFTTDNIVFNPNGSTSKTIYVRFTPGTATSQQSATLTISGGGATTTKPVSATAVNILPSVTTTTPSGITSYAATLSGNVTTQGCYTITARGIVYGTTSNPTVGSSTTLTDTNVGTGAFSFNVTLTPNTAYYVRAYTTYNNGTIEYGTNTAFSTPVITVAIPYSQDFEGATPEWNLNNNVTGPASPNKWVIGNGTNNGGSKALYISNNGSTYAYTTGTSANPTIETQTFASLRVDLTGIPSNIATTLTFDCMGRGENNYDYGELYINGIAAGNLLSLEQEFYNLPAWVTKTYNLTSFNGTVITLNFKWKNDNTSGTTPPFAIDNIKIAKQIAAPVATAATLLATPTTGFTANWNAAENGVQSYKLDVSTSATFTASGLGTTTEGFGNLTALSTTSYNSANNNVLLESGTWIFDYASKGQTPPATYNGELCQLKSGTGKITTPSFNNISTITFWARTTTGTSASGTIIVQKIVNGATTNVNSYTTGNTGTPNGFQQYTVNLNLTEAAKIVFHSSSGTNYIDDIVINHSTIVPSFVTGYENLTVNGTSAPVTGLTDGATYHYRVRAGGAAGGIGANTTSANSNIIAAVAKAAKIWATNGGTTTWSPSAPASTDAAFIQAPYTADAGFEVATLNVNNKLTIKSGKTVTIHQALVSNDSIIVENNAALVLKENATQSGLSLNKTKVLRNSNPLFRLDYTLWGAPVTGQQLLAFSPLTSVNPVRFYTYGMFTNQTTGQLQEGYVTANQTDNFVPGTGYLIRTPNVIAGNTAYNQGNATYTHNGTFKGIPNNGTVAVAIGAQAGHYIAVANPYPSPIGVAKFFQDNSGVIESGNGIYFWRKKNNASNSSYGHLTLAGYAANENENGGDFYSLADGQTGYNTNWIISPAQGFLVKVANTPTANNVVFNNLMRKEAPVGGQPFFRTLNNNDTNDAPEVSRWWINVTSATAFAQTLVAYIPEATLGLDYGYDAKSLSDGSIKVYSKAEADNMAIQARPSFVDTDVVPMGFAVSTAGQYTFKLAKIDGVFAQGQDVFIKDNLLGTVSNLKTADYTFTTDSGTFDTRFEVVYQPQGQLGTDTPLLENSVVVYQNNGTINITSGTIDMTGIAIYDVRGRKLYEQTGINGTEASVSNLGVANQMLIVEINTVNGKVTKKILY